MKNEDGGGSTLTVVELDTAHAEAAPPRSAWISASFRSHHGVVVDISDSRARESARALVKNPLDIGVRDERRRRLASQRHGSGDRPGRELRHA